MRELYILLFTIFPIFSFSQDWSRVDTFKVWVKDSLLIQHVLNISTDTIQTYEIKTDIRKDGVYQIFSDSLLTKIIYQTGFSGNYKVGQDIYWYLNGNKSMQFESIETICPDTFYVYESVFPVIFSFRLSKKIGLFTSWYPEGNIKSKGRYILSDRCSSKKNGTWTYWDKGGRMTVINYEYSNK